MKQFDYDKFLKNNPLLNEMGSFENEYTEMDNYQLIDILTKIHDVYNNEAFAESQPVFLEAAKHIKMAIDLIKRRSGN